MGRQWKSVRAMETEGKVQEKIYKADVVRFTFGCMHTQDTNIFYVVRSGLQENRKAAQPCLPPPATRLHFPECRAKRARPEMSHSHFRRRWPRIIMATLRSSVLLWGLLTGSRNTERVSFPARTRLHLGTLLQLLPRPCGAGLPCRRLASEAGK